MEKEKWFLGLEYSRIGATLMMMTGFILGVLMDSFWAVLVFPVGLLLAYLGDKYIAPKIKS